MVSIACLDIHFCLLQLPQDYRCEQYLRNEAHLKRCSRASDTSSAYSGSDMMQSSIDDQESPEIDLSGLPEGQVDSDDDEDRESLSEVWGVPSHHFGEVIQDWGGWYS